MTSPRNLFLLSFILVALVILIISVGRRWLTATSRRKIGRVFDIGFTRFITNVLVSVLWCIALVHLFVDYAYGILTAFGIMQPILELEVLLFTPTRFLLSALTFQHPIVAVFVSTILLFLNLIFYRVFFELIIVLFRIESHLRAMRERGEEQKS